MGINAVPVPESRIRSAGECEKPSSLRPPSGYEITHETLIDFRVVHRVIVDCLLRRIHNFGFEHAGKHGRGQCHKTTWMYVAVPKT